MTIFIARHGQVADSGEWPSGYKPISPLGQEQARRLGRRLADLGFAGRVYTSPYHRCLETAQIVCEELDQYFYPEPLIGERRFPWATKFRGYTVQEVKERFTRCAPDAHFDWPWWPEGTETKEEVEVRVAGYLSDLVKRRETALLIGHGATTDAAFAHLTGIRTIAHYNATLSAIEVSPAVRVLMANDAAHLDEGQVTSNQQVIA